MVACDEVSFARIHACCFSRYKAEICGDLMCITGHFLAISSQRRWRLETEYDTAAVQGRMRPQKRVQELLLQWRADALRSVAHTRRACQVLRKS